jgi:uncharacterized phage protein (TIGR01671 family)
MREINFRGRRVDNGLWVYGYFMKTPITTEFNCNGQFLDSGENGRYCIVQDNVAHEIDIKTLGEFTGLKDINGKDIYEDDVCECVGGESAQGVHEFQEIGKVVFKDGCFGIENEKDDVFLPFFYLIEHGFEIFNCGSIYENPELLEAEE